MISPIEINAMGKPCPLPLLLLKKQLKKTPELKSYMLKASDPNSQIDIARYCQIHHYSLKLEKISENEFHYWIET